MIYPTRRAILLAALGVPIALIVGVAAPAQWLAGLAWLGVVLGVIIADALLSAWPSDLQLESALPKSLPMGTGAHASFTVAFPAKSSPQQAELALDANAFITPEPKRERISLIHGAGEGRFQLSPLRRGAGKLRQLWVRWQGPLGLIWKQSVRALETDIPIIPDIESVKNEALRLFQRNALFGLNAQRDIGDGAEFHALAEFRAGMDRRTIDWKQTARHRELLAKEFHTERNQQIIIALDSGRLMCEPLEGQPRIDRALHAALLLSYAALKLGDRVGLFAFDAKKRFSSGAVAGARAFPLLQRLAARIDYTNEETNYTLGLTQLAGELKRRSLVVVFTEFADTTSAELMIENVAQLLRRHLVLFVVFRDEELETMADNEPIDGQDMSRAVIADSLLRERELVITRLKRLGVEIVDAPANRAGANLLNTYLALKRRNVL